MLTELFIKEINLIVKYFNAYENASFVVPTAADSFLLSSFRILTEHMFVIWILFHCFWVIVNFIKVEWQKYQIMVEILK